MQQTVVSESEWARQQSAQHGGLSGFQLLPHGMEAYARRMLLAERAEHTLDIQTYILEDSHSIRRLLRHLIAAAERGVKIRLLIDDLTVGHQQGRLSRLESHPNISIRVFNPIRSGRRFAITRIFSLMLDARRLNRRMHNKLWITDGAYAIWGGRNLSDRYFYSDAFSFFDMDALAVGGETVSDLQASFDCYWKHPLAEPLSSFIRAKAGEWQRLDVELRLRCHEQSEIGQVYDDALADLRDDPREVLLEQLEWAKAVVHYDDPESMTFTEKSPNPLRMNNAIKKELESVKESLQIVAGYFIPHDLNGIDIFALLNRGVKVAIMTNSLESTDVPLVHGAYARWRRPLLKAGAKLFETRYHVRSRQRLIARIRTRTRLKLSRTRTSSLHAKTFVFDRDRIMIASFNFDPRSVWWNSEIGVVIHSAKLNRELSLINAIGMLPEYSYRLRLINGVLRWFSISHTQKLREYTFERGNPWRRFQGWLSRVLGIEHLL
ncbi:Cardiolipin synthase C [Halomonadaceae bacterium LMG 33818]|uniref:phospholipase D family protein n=1 Tax=Cernens ardua TaxID=3402176 RepID=UPI003EDBD2DF